MAIYLEETFDSAGYDDADWSETVGDGTVDEDDTTISDPLGGSSQILEVEKAAPDYDALTRNDLADDYAVTYTRLYFYLSAHGLTSNNDKLLIAFALTVGWDVPWSLFLLHDGSKPNLVFEYYSGGSQNQDYDYGELSTGQWYCLEVYYDATSELWEWKVDDVSINNGSLTDAHYVGVGRLVVADNQNDFTELAYYDFVKIQSDGWIGAVGVSLRQINIGDAWKAVSGVQINIGDAWKDVTEVQINIGDSWKKL